MKKQLIILISIILIILVSLGCYIIYSNNTRQDTSSDISKKADSQIKYFTDVIVSCMNQFNNISYSNYTARKTKCKY